MHTLRFKEKNESDANKGRQRSSQKKRGRAQMQKPLEAAHPTLPQEFLGWFIGLRAPYPHL